MEFEMKKTALAATLLLACATVFAKPYPKYDVVKSVLHDQGFDGDAADKIREDLADHAGEYPPKFDNEADRKRAEKDVVTLARLYSGLIEQKIVTEKQPERYRSVLHSIARLSWIAHNLDVPGAAAKADQHYRMLLAAFRLNIPAVFVSGGPMEAGKAIIRDGQAVTSLDLINAMTAAVDPNVSDEELWRIEASACPTCGSCTAPGLFVASTSLMVAPCRPSLSPSACHHVPMSGGCGQPGG